MRDLPRLRKRLETPAVRGFKKRRAGPPLADITAPPLSALPSHPASGQDRALPEGTTKQRAPHETPLPQAFPALQADADSRTVSELATITAVSVPDERKLAKQRAVKAIEARLREARDARQKEAQTEALAVKLAKKLLGDLFSGELTRVDALVMFNDLSTKQGVPADVRTRIRKEYFGR